MSDNELNEQFDLDDKRAEIVPAIRKSGKGNQTTKNFFLFRQKIYSKWERMRIIGQKGMNTVCIVAVCKFFFISGNRPIFFSTNMDLTINCDTFVKMAIYCFIEFRLKTCNFHSLFSECLYLKECVCWNDLLQLLVQGCKNGLSYQSI